MLPGPNRPAANGSAPFGAAPKHSKEGHAMFARHISKALLASLTAGIATFAMTPAQAELDAPRSVIVHYSDLDLKSDGGRATLNKRIAFAAQTVCGRADELSYYSRMSTAACEDRAITNASRGLVEVFANAEGTIRVAAN